VIILYSNRTGRPSPIPTAGPRQQPPPLMYRQPAFQPQAKDIPSSSTPPMFQAQPGGFDTGAEDQLPWYEMRVDDIFRDHGGGRRAAGRRGWHITVGAATTGFDSAVTVGGRRSDHGRHSDTGGRWSVTGRRWSVTGRQIDTECSRLVAGGDTVSRPARTAGRQGTGPLDVRPGPDLGWRLSS
jgi:hypothetical protein